MPTIEIIDGNEVKVYSDVERAEGLTKARLAANLARVGSNESQFATDADYAAWVCAAVGIATLPTTAAESYFEQYAGKTVVEMETALSDAIIAASEANPEAPLPTPTVAAIPQRVSMRQARLALLGAGLLSTIDAAIASLPSPQKEAAQIEWEYSAYVERSNALIASLSTALGMTAEQMDALFVQAATL